MIPAIVGGVLGVVAALISVFAARGTDARIREEIQDLQRIRSFPETPDGERVLLGEVITSRIERLLELCKVTLPVKRLNRLLVAGSVLTLIMLPVISHLQSQARSHDRSAAYLQAEQTQAVTAFRKLPQPFEGLVLSRSYDLQDRVESFGNQANEQREESRLDRASAVNWARAALVSGITSLILAVPLLLLAVRTYRRTRARTSQKRRLRFRMPFEVYLA